MRDRAPDPPKRRHVGLPQIFSYIGDWLDDKCNGYGVYTHSSGTVYKGYWENDKQNGYGEEVYPDGSYYKGHFKGSKK